MGKTTLTREVEVVITPEEAAETFANFDNEEQVRFLNEVASQMRSWSFLYDLQLHHISISDDLTDDARDLMRKFGEYSEKHI